MQQVASGGAQQLSGEMAEQLAGLVAELEGLKYSAQCFKGVVISATGCHGEERRLLRRAAALARLDLQPALVRSATTHLVVCGTPAAAAQRSNKLPRAREWGIPVVTLQWLLDSIGEGGPLPVEPYLVQLPAAGSGPPAQAGQQEERERAGRDPRQELASLGPHGRQHRPSSVASNPANPPQQASAGTAARQALSPLDNVTGQLQSMAISPKPQGAAGSTAEHQHGAEGVHEAPSCSPGASPGGDGSLSLAHLVGAQHGRSPSGSPGITSRPGVPFSGWRASPEPQPSPMLTSPGSQEPAHGQQFGGCSPMWASPAAGTGEAGASPSPLCFNGPSPMSGCSTGADSGRSSPLSTASPSGASRATGAGAGVGGSSAGGLHVMPAGEMGLSSGGGSALQLGLPCSPPREQQHGECPVAHPRLPWDSPGLYAAAPGSVQDSPGSSNVQSPAQPPGFPDLASPRAGESPGPSPPWSLPGPQLQQEEADLVCCSPVAHPLPAQQHDATSLSGSGAADTAAAARDGSARSPASTASLPRPPPSDDCHITARRPHLSQHQAQQLAAGPAATAASKPKTILDWTDDDSDSDGFPTPQDPRARRAAEEQVGPVVIARPLPAAPPPLRGDTVGLKFLKAAPRGNCVREHHGLGTLKGVQFAEQVQVAAAGLTLSTKDKKSAVKLHTPDSEGHGAAGEASTSHEAVLGEPLAFYQLPEGGWYLEYAQLYTAGQAEALAEARGLPLSLPLGFDRSSELLRSTARQHARLEDILGSVAVRRVKQGGTTLRLKGGAAALFWRTAFDPSTLKCVTDRPAKDYIEIE